MHSASESILIHASPEETWQTLTDLPRLPEWYTPARRIRALTDGPVREGWQFVLAVKTLSGIVLDALGTVTRFDPEQRVIVWRGQTFGISGDSRWQVVPAENGFARIEHTFAGQGWLMFLSQKLGRNPKTVKKRLENLKRLVEARAKNNA